MRSPMSWPMHRLFDQGFERFPLAGERLHRFPVPFLHPALVVGHPVYYHVVQAITLVFEALIGAALGRDGMPQHQGDLAAAENEPGNDQSHRSDRGHRVRVSRDPVRPPFLRSIPPITFLPLSAFSRQPARALEDVALTKSTCHKLQTCEPMRGNVPCLFGRPGGFSSFRYEICTLEVYTSNFQSSHHRGVHELQLLHYFCNHGFHSTSATCGPFHFPSVVSTYRNCICCLQCRLYSRFSNALSFLPPIAIENC